MKSIYNTLLSLASCLLMTNAIAQTPSCCSMSSTASFAALGSDKDFLASHTNPVPFHFVAAKGAMISITPADGKKANVFEVKADKATNNYLIIVHEWWGLNDYIKKEAERLQSELGNVNVLAVDLYDGKVATTAEEAGKYMESAKEKRIRAILNATIAYAGKDARIETLGWCFGGGWSLQATLAAGKQATGCVMYYGMPEKDVNKIKTLKAPVLGIFATQDKWITPEVVDSFVTVMKKNGKDIKVETYTADHAFANPSNPKYNKAIADAANKVALDFLRAHLR
jgi:carboxymethylenebutenolidase